MKFAQAITSDRRLLGTVAVVLVLIAGLIAWFALRPGPEAARNATTGLTIRHAQGRTVVPAGPKSVLVFDPGALDILDALGVLVKGVGGSNFPDYLAKYGKPPYEAVGTLFEADMEKVATLKPDLIVVGGRSSRQYAALAPLAPTIDLSSRGGDFVENTVRKTALLGRIFGKQARADDVTAELRAAVDRARKATGGAGRGLVILTTGGRISAFGPGEGSRFGYIYADFGVTPAMPETKQGAHGNRASAEYIRALNPDWLFVVDRDTATGRVDAAGNPVARKPGEQSARRGGGANGGGGGGRQRGGNAGKAVERERQDRPGMGARQTLDNPLIAQTTAWRKGQVVYLDPRSWYIVGGGVQNATHMADEIATAIGRGGTPAAN